MIYYLWILFASALFSLQFLLNRAYQRSAGASLGSAVCFSLFSNLAIAIAMFLGSGLTFRWTPFSLALALLMGATNLGYLFCSTKALSMANMSAFSVFAMLGGMFLPFTAGILLWREELSWGKGIGCILIFAALFLGLQKGENHRKSNLYCLAVFVLNGLFGVWSKWHQSDSSQSVSSTSFSLLASLCTVGLCLLVLLFVRPAARQLPAILHSGKNWGCMAGYGLINGGANLVALVALLHLPASVQYPLITGAVIVFSTLLGLFMGEKPTAKGIGAAALSFAAMLAVCL